MLNLKDNDELFELIKSSFKEKITKWAYFVNWAKVFENVDSIEIELNILNSLIGKTNIETETYRLIKQYPEVIKAFPFLIAVRANSLDILVDTKNFNYQNFDFSERTLSDNECKELASFVVNSGIGELLKDKKVKNLVDYVTGVEVGLDSNGRKNRGGSLMESLVEEFVSDACKKNGLPYMPQATASKIKRQWGLDVVVDKSSRQIDFAINKNGKLYFIECNFYGGGGSKLKSTASEYVEMNRYWNKQGIIFIWITDGAGWRSTSRPLREFFDKADYLLNLHLLSLGVLNKIIK
ncbi:MAG: type II restriction endonuclease [Bacteroidota bacterium]